MSKKNIYGPHEVINQFKYLIVSGWPRWRSLWRRGGEAEFMFIQDRKFHCVLNHIRTSEWHHWRPGCGLRRRFTLKIPGDFIHGHVHAPVRRVYKYISVTGLLLQREQRVVICLWWRMDTAKDRSTFYRITPELESEQLKSPEKFLSSEHNY